MNDIIQARKTSTLRTVDFVQGNDRLLENLIQFGEANASTLKKSRRKKAQIKMQMKYDPPFMKQQKLEQERMKIQNRYKIERLKEALNLKQAALVDPALAQKQFNEVYSQVYKHRQNKMKRELELIEEYFTMAPEQFEPDTLLKQIEVLEERKEKQKILESREQEIKDLIKSNALQQLIKKFNIHLKSDEDLSNLERIFLKCSQDLSTFYKYKEANFFQTLLNGKKMANDRKMFIKNIRDWFSEQKLQEAREMEKIKQDQLLKNFWENQKLKKVLKHTSQKQSDSNRSQSFISQQRMSAYSLREKYEQQQNQKRKFQIRKSSLPLSISHEKDNLQTDSVQQSEYQSFRMTNSSQMPPMLQAITPFSQMFTIKPHSMNRSVAHSIEFPSSPEKPQTFKDPNPNIAQHRMLNKLQSAQDTRVTSNSQLTSINIPSMYETSKNGFRDTSIESGEKVIGRVRFRANQSLVVEKNKKISDIIPKPRERIHKMFTPELPKFEHKRSQSKFQARLSSPPESPAKDKKVLDQLIQACYFLESEGRQSDVNDAFLGNKIKMLQLQEEIRKNNFDETVQLLQEFEQTDQPSNIKTLYFYNQESQIDYGEITKEIVEEYKSGKLDPGREVGKIEKSRSKVRKLIENLKNKLRKA